MNPPGGRVSARLFPDGRPERVVALIGNPNVGKSTLFNHVTGQDVFTAHYPGKTPDVNVGTTHVGDTELSIVDLPGVYAIDGGSAEARLARSTLLDVSPDACVIVLDSTNLTRNLVLALQVLDLGIPSVIALNLCDEAGRCGLAVDSELLGTLLGADVIQTVATQGMGIAEVMDRAVGRIETSGGELPRHRYGDVFERALSPLVQTLAREAELPYDLSARSTALELIEDPAFVESEFPENRRRGLSRVAEEARASLAVLTAEEPRTALARERHGAAGIIAGRCTGSTYTKLTLQDRLLSYTTRARTGVPLLILVLLTIFGLLFFVGGFLAEIFSSLWAAFGSPLIQGVVGRLFGDGPLATTLLWGLDAGIEASLGIGLPYILTFYFMLSLLEDTGYLNSVAFLTDRAMHNVGLHGRAVIPLVAGAGCSVPAVLSVRVLPSDRERFIGATLVSFVPCSARTAVILGAAGAFIGWLPALGVYLVTLAVAWGVGLAMDRLIPGSSPGFVMEMFPFRRPRVRIVGRKAWAQFKEFLFVATPLVVIGSMVLGGLYESGWLFEIAGPLEPIVVGWLGLPAFAGLTLLFGLLRKEFALQLLVALAIATTGGDARELSELMTSTQIFVYVLVNTLAMPCISTLAVLGRVLGWKRAGGVLLVTVTVAVLIGGFFARLLPLLGGPWTA